MPRPLAPSLDPQLASEIRPVVVIPLYKLELSALEWASFASITSVLAPHPIAILAPRRFAPLLGDWLAARLDLAVLQLQLHLVDAPLLADVPAYNHLMLQPWFYEHYQGFSHLLIAQLDSYVFRDELLHWCRQPYAYLGAPIYPEGAAYGEAGCQAVGCGGFSLRALAAFRKAFARNPRLVGLADLPSVIRGYNLRGAGVRLLRLLRLLLSGDCRLRQRHNLVQRRLGLNEDVIFGKVLPRVLPWFTVPDYATACRFCLDRYVERDLADLAGLPFGAHGWFKTPAAVAAWRAHIPALQA
ncbi:MAG: DUF5672 family protein [Cyanobium sp.]